MTKDEERAVATDELAALRAENEALRRQLEAQQERGPLWRRILAGVLAVLAIVAVLAAVDVVWLKTTLTDEDQFVATLRPLPQNEAVAGALSIRVAEGVIEVTGVEESVATTLPSGLSFLAAPLTDAVGEFVAGVTDEVIRSDVFTTVWTGALRVTHVAVSAVLSGNDRALVAEGGVVAIDLDEAAAIVADRLREAGLSLPELDGINLGQIVIYEDDDLAVAQTVAEGIDTAGWFLPFVALLLIAAAIWVAPNRRRMTAILGFGTAIGLLLSLAGLRIARNAILDGIDDEVTRAGAGAIWDTILRRLIQGSWALLVLALIVGLVAWGSGPSPRAQRLRGWGSRTIDGWRRPAETTPRGFTAFLAEWKRTIQVVVVVLGLLFVLFGPDPSGLLVIVTTAVVLFVVVLVEVLAGPPQGSRQDKP